MSTTQKLTKKQKKGLAFRERQSSKRKPGDATIADMDDNAVPIMEDQDLATISGDGLQIEGDPKQTKSTTSTGEVEKGSGQSEGKGKEKRKQESGLDVESNGPRKRKRESEVDVEEVKKSAVVKRKKSGDEESGEGVGKDVGSTTAQQKQRFILFVGNLKYTTSREAIAAHFAACDPPPSIRLLTPKPKPGSTQRAKSKGCAFLEFTHRNALQQALKLHQSMLEDRMINVELTAGGGGNSGSRLEKVRERNKALLVQRKDRVEKDKSNSDQKTFPSMPDKPQRYSKTSGLEQKLLVKRTWTVEDEVDDGKTRRGGKKHAKGSKTRVKDWGTGVNAIPVG